MLKNQNAITLIALVITIIVLIILSAVSINLAVGNSGIISNAMRARVVSDFATYQEELKKFIITQTDLDEDFDKTMLSASVNSYCYNNVQDGNKTIKDIIPSFDDTYAEQIEIIKGELLLTLSGKNKRNDNIIADAAEMVGIRINPYVIIDGVLMSNDRNLSLAEDGGTVIIPDKVRSIGEGAFSKVSGVKTIIIPRTCKTIERGAFRSNKELEKVIFEEGGVETIGAHAFDGCENLKEVQFANCTKRIDTQAFYGCKSLQDLILPEDLEFLGHWAFSYVPITQITIPNKLTEIKGSVFESCKNLETVNIPASVNTIAASAFSNDTKLEHINIDSGNNSYVYEEGLLMNKLKTEIIFVSDAVLKNKNYFAIPNGITKFNFSFDKYDGITKIIIPSTITELDISTWKYIEDIEIDENNQAYCVENKCLYSKDKQTLVFSFTKSSDITIANTVKTIIKRSFLNETEAKRIIIPDSVTTIENEVFNKCKKLEYMKIGKGVTSLNPIFKYQNFAGTVEIDNDNPKFKIEDGVIYSKDGKTIITVVKDINGEFILNPNVEKIDSYAFHGRLDLKSIKLSEGLKEIHSSFQSCGLTEIVIPSSVTYISKNAFSNSSYLERVIIKQNEPTNGTLKDNAPYGCILGLRSIIWNPNYSN